MKFLSKELLHEKKPKVSFPPHLQLRDHVREVGKAKGGHLIYEFVGTDTFSSEWNERRRYEIDAGRDEEPLLYEPVYDIVQDASLPRLVDIKKIGPGGVVFEEVLEGGEVKFATVTSSEQSVRIRHYAQGLEYSKDLVVFNELWQVPIVERQVGIAYNALLNHIHLNPILTGTYAAANQTAANTAGATTVEDFFLTIEDAITNAKTDATNPRRGPYVLLISSAQMFTVEKALMRVPQQGASQQSSALDMIRSVIAYDGWTGTRGGKSTTYAGVTSGTGYLVSLQYQDQDFQSYMKQDLMQDPNEDYDLSRFMTQLAWDCYFGAYANPTRAVEEITWPS